MCFLLIQDEAHLLEEMGPRLAPYTLKTLTRKGIEVFLDSQVTRLLPEGAEINHDKVVPT
ncbi:MAG: hypothetical protein QGH66_03760 [Dehalococcoidia bacterium]|nr:hypothetical protein [Dehalococcoidia bacterium]